MRCFVEGLKQGRLTRNLLVGFTSLLLSAGGYASESRCLIVASYHDGFIGQKLKVQGALDVLEGKCQIKQFDMDTKRNPDQAFGEAKALEAKQLIEEWKPDVVITIDDNAAKYLVQPYYKDADLPIVFSGVDWTAEAYGFPYNNVTGMIEVAPMQALVRQMKRINPEAKTLYFMRPDRFSAVKNVDRMTKVLDAEGIDVVDLVVKTMDGFEQQYLEAQKGDFILFTNNAAIEGWDDKRASEYMLKHSETLVLTQSDWMVPFSMLAFTKVIEEQGEYAAEVALKILEGHKPSEFPIVSNRKWNIYINEPLLKKSGVALPAGLIRKAEKYNP